MNSAPDGMGRTVRCGGAAPRLAQERVSLYHNMRGMLFLSGMAGA